MSFDIKSIRQEFKDKGIYYTPSGLAEYIKTLVDIDTDEVYDPTCGDGSLLSVFGEEVGKYGQEINGEQLSVAEGRLSNFTGVCGDTLSNPAFMDRQFRVIVANPPFSIKWEPTMTPDPRFDCAPARAPKGKADYAFLLHILYLLADDGIAVTLNFPGVLYRGNSEGKIRKWMIDRNYISKVVLLPGGMFVDTSIATAVIVLRKNKSTTDIEIEDRNINITRTVPLEEIKNNDYSLSPGIYVQENKHVDKIDPMRLQYLARQGAIKRLKADIEMDRMVCEMEGYSFADYLAEIRRAVNEFCEEESMKLKGATA